MSKEQGFIAPLLLGGAEWLLLADRGEPLRARFRLLLPVTAVAVLLFVVRGILLNGNVRRDAGPSPAPRALSPAGRLVVDVSQRSIPEWATPHSSWPMHLQADYGPPGIPVGWRNRVRHLFGLLLVCSPVFAWLFVRWRRRDPVAAFPGLLWAAVALAPVSNLITPTGIVMAERVLFLPTVGLAVMVACTVFQR